MIYVVSPIAIPLVLGYFCRWKFIANAIPAERGEDQPGWARLTELLPADSDSMGRARLIATVSPH